MPIPPERRAFSVSAYIRNEGQILLVNHVKQKTWVPIGGEIEAEETPLEALVREVREEVGWEEGRDYHLPLVGLSPSGFLTYEEHQAGPKGLHMNFAFVLLGQHRNITPCNEYTEIAWVSSPPPASPPNVKHLVYKALAF
jgi:8-oxo-dGTP pyrophosphatase MutT (NUDIX family)